MKTSWEMETKKKYPKLSRNAETEVLVIGAGLAGVWCAYLLSKSGKKVILIEKDRVGKGQTHYTTAFINQFVDTSLVHLTKMFSPEVAMLVTQSGGDAIRLIDEAIKAEKIDCEFKYSSSFVYARTDDEFNSLKDEHRLARLYGFDTRLVRKADIPVENVGALEFKKQAKFHPTKFLSGLVAALEKMGVGIFEKTEALEIVGTNPVKVVTKEGNIIEADDVVVATYEPFNNPKAVHYKKGMYVSYVLELALEKNKLKEGMYIDMSNPYHYTRVDSLEGEKDRMIVGGEDHRSELPISSVKNFKALREFVKKSFAGIKYKEVTKWKGGILEPTDGLALIGEVSPHQYVATAFSGNGMTYSAIAGMILRSLILGKESAYAEIYNPKRRMKGKALLYKARDYTGELVGGALKNIFK